MAVADNGRTMDREFRHTKAFQCASGMTAMAYAVSTCAKAQEPIAIGGNGHGTEARDLEG